MKVESVRAVNLLRALAVPDEPKLNKPLSVAVWPGMGQVALSGGYHLMAKLGMHILAEFSPRELFDVEHIDVKAGPVKSSRLSHWRLSCN
jgi:uncharacterized protein